jgi:hypothetical protein
VRRVQFWAVVIFALAIAMTTALDHSFAQKGAMNASVTGLVLVFAAGLEIIRLHWLMDAVLALMGTWLVAAPFILSYEEFVAFAHVALGLMLLIIGVLQRFVGPKPPLAL